LGGLRNRALGDPYSP